MYVEMKQAIHFRTPSRVSDYRKGTELLMYSMMLCHISAGTIPAAARKIDARRRLG
jgi:hypothetical protein